MPALTQGITTKSAGYTPEVAFRRNSTKTRSDILTLGESSWRYLRGFSYALKPGAIDASAQAVCRWL